MQLRRINCFGNELRFHKEHGWTEELLTSALAVGFIVDMGKYYKLGFEQNKIAYFEPTRLYDLSGEVMKTDGSIAEEKHALWLIEIYGQSNIFSHGDDESWHKRRARAGKFGRALE